ncbi:phage integrase SAM-like domain-containing protein [Streptomyces acidiscabies]|uniref:phage integrase SAM-like domain-containing protein n=1 Tax=Streptomyces acidiscabies TaxID=42234 RepID=UPI000951F95D|nr:phage integrase SAM-like domain-containing protein [Streptomyces acidiscabies]
MPSVETRGNSIRVKWWSGEYHLDDDGKPTKKKRYDSVSGPEDGVPFADEKEARKYGLDRESDVRNQRNRRRAADRVTMPDYCDRWTAGLNLRVRSEVTYRSRVNSVIKPYWNQWTVDQIDPSAYDSFKSYVEKKYSHNYAKNVLGVFKMMMDDAVVKHRLRDSSPVIVQKNRGIYKKRQTRRTKRKLSIQSVHQAAVNAYALWGYAGWTYIWTLAFTCNRPPGEMFGLQRGYCSPYWPRSERDPELKQEAMERYAGLDVMRVQYQAYTANGKPVLAAPKYDSRRSVVLPPFLHQMHRALLSTHNEPWAFLSITGKPLVWARFKEDYWCHIQDGLQQRTRPPVGASNGLPPVAAVKELGDETAYRLRHWARALLDEPGNIPEVAIEARMGHELRGVVGVYSEVTLAMEERIVEYLQGVWEKEIVGAGLWIPSYPIPLPPSLTKGTPPLFSDLPILQYE